MQLGAGTFVLHQTSTLVNSILVNFGLSEEMHYPVSLSLLQSFIAYLQLQIQENQCSRAIPATNTISPCKHSHIDTALNLLGTYCQQLQFLIFSFGISIELSTSYVGCSNRLLKTHLALLSYLINVIYSDNI